MSEKRTQMRCKNGVYFVNKTSISMFNGNSIQCKTKEEEEEEKKQLNGKICSVVCVDVKKRNQRAKKE